MDMKTYILKYASSIGQVLVHELNENKQEVSNYGSDQWSDADKRAELLSLDDEVDSISKQTVLFSARDSVYGKTALQAVFPPYPKKDTDVITISPQMSVLQLSEAKYVIKKGGLGPFGGRSSFRNRISSKFLDVEGTLASQSVPVSPLRIIVVTEEHLPLAIEHVHALIDGGYEKGSFSSDNLVHQYVLCSSNGLRQIIDDPTFKHNYSDDYLYFQL